MRAVLVILMVVLSLCVSGQVQYRFQHITIKDGLSQNTVNCVFKDKQGNYWLGTQDGLDLYDGYSVKIFRHDREDSTTISDNFILSIAEDHEGNIWVGTRNGINLFDRSARHFRRIIADQKEREEYHNNIRNIFIDSGGNVLFSNVYGQLVKVTGDVRKGSSFRTQVIRDKVSLVNTPPEIYCVSDGQDIVIYNKEHKMLWQLSDSIVGSLKVVCPLSGNTALLGTSKGLFVMRHNRPERLKTFDGKDINTILSDSKRDAWIGTTTGLYVVRGEDLSKPFLIANRADDPASISGNNIQSIYEDPKGLVWVGTSEGGVNIYDTKNIFFVFNHETSIPLSSGSVWSIYQDRNELWVGTTNGLDHLIMANDTVSALYSGRNNIVRSEVFIRSKNASNSICSDLITSITKDKQGHFWFGSHDNGISVYDPLSRKWEHYDTKNSPLRSNIIHHLMCATDGKVWISTLAGFYFYDPAQKFFRSFLPNYIRDSGYSSGYIMSIYEDRRKTIWASSTAGLYHLAANGDRIAVYNSHPGDLKGLSYIIATSCFEDSKDRFWVATLGGGLDMLDREKGIFSHYTTKEGLSNNVVYGILEDTGGKLWLTTNNFISVFDPNKKVFRTLSDREGLPSREFAQNAFLKNNKGEFLFGSPEGLVVCDPSMLAPANTELPVHISSLRINYNDVNYAAEHPIKLFYKDKTITFEFASTDLRLQDRLRYAFKLEGFDNDWNDASALRRTATYTNLPIGNYVFKVRVRAENEDWQEKMLNVDVEVIPPFWRTTWFLAVEILLALAAIVFFVRYYSQRQLKKKLRAAELAQKIHEERERISRDLHDNVGSHLTYIISSLDNINDNKMNSAASRDEISKLSDFSRDTMRQLRDSIWALNKETITLGELRDRISDHAHKMTSVTGMSFTMECSANEQLSIPPSKAINIFRVVQEAIHNAVKHSGASLLAVHIQQNDHTLTIGVNDNGKGLTNTGSGYGLNNMRDRVSELHGTMQIVSHTPGGVKVTFNIPLNTANAVRSNDN